MDLKLTLFRKEKISIGKSNKLKAPIKGLLLWLQFNAYLFLIERSWILFR